MLRSFPSCGKLDISTIIALASADSLTFYATSIVGSWRTRRNGFDETDSTVADQRNVGHSSAGSDMFAQSS